MNLHLVAGPLEVVTLGPADWYRLDGSALKEGTSGRILARYDGERWNAGQAHYTTILCEGPAICHFEDGTGRRGDAEGPFATLMLVGGVLWAEDHALARLDAASATWRHHDSADDFRSISWRTEPHRR